MSLENIQEPVPKYLQYLQFHVIEYISYMAQITFSLIEDLSNEYNIFIEYLGRGYQCKVIKMFCVDFISVISA